MTKKYVPVRMPLEAYNNIMLKKRKMEGVIKELTRNDIKVPLTTVWTMVSKNPLQLPDEYLIKKVKRKRWKLKQYVVRKDK